MSKILQQLFSQSKTLVFIFSFFLGGQIWGQLTAEFTTKPAYTSSVINVCSGSQVLFVLSDINTTSITPTTTVNWIFTGGASISSSQMRTPFAVTFTSSGTAKLKLQDGATISEKTIDINVVSSPPLSPNLINGTGGGLPLTVSTLSGITKFNYCPVNESGIHNISLNTFLHWL